MNLIFNALAFINGYNGSANTKVNFFKEEGYYKNAVVSLVSAKTNNKNDDVALVTNVEVPLKYKKLLDKNGIKIFYVDFNYFIFPDKMKWSLAFYKLCALKYIVEHTYYKNICLIDTDTVTIRNYKEMWLEAKNSILFYDIQHSLYIKQAEGMNNEYKKLMLDDRLLENKGGEYLCGSKENLIEFINHCKKYYELMLTKKFQTEYGDEFLIACAYEKEIKQKARNANAYIYRYWTSTFHLISTNNIYNQVCILHVPDEKNSGMITLFSYLDAYDTLPKENKLNSILGLPKKKNILIKKIVRTKHLLMNKIRNKVYLIMKR